MRHQRHLIGRTVLELDIGDLADVWGLQEEVSSLFQQQVVPEISRLFDRLVAVDQVVRFDQVVVEVGSLDRRFLAEELSSKLLVALNQILGNALQNTVLSESLSEARSTEQTTLIQRDRTTADWEVFLYFLQYGRLPWWVPAGNRQDWFSRWEAVIRSNTNWRIPLQKLLRANIAAQQRLVEQLPESFRRRLILRIQSSWKGWFTLLAQARRLMQTLGLRNSTIQQLERQAWRLLLSEIASEQIQISLPAERWIFRWLERLVQAYLEEVVPDALEYSNFVSRLRDSFITMSSERSLWLTALDQVVSISSLDVPILRSDLEVWLYFLQQGHLSEGQSSRSWEEWLSCWEAVMQSETNWQESVKTVLANNSIARQRLVHQFPESFRHQLIVQMQPMWIGWYALLEQAQQVLQTMSLSSNEIEHLVTQAWLIVLSEMVSESGRLRPLPVANWIRNWLTHLIQVAIDASVPSSIVSHRLRTLLEAAAIEGLEVWLAQVDQAIALSSIRGERDRPRERSQPSDATRSVSEEEESGLYVTQAGLVLLHPFLSFYFDAIGLLQGESFRDEIAQQSAIYLLYYLATKQTDVPEYELVFPKLLCGWSLDQPVVRGLELPIAALREGENLLQTVINYWEVLKSTSPDGLREGFLQREGKLTRINQGNWKLQVEQNSIDILLGSLPWGLSMVKLPWMDDLLIVEWS